MSLAAKFLRSALRRFDRFFSVSDVNPDPLVLYTFTAGRTSKLTGWRVFSDADFGGLSKASFSLASDGQSAVFSGRYSRELPDDCSLVRAGYCGVHSVRARNLTLVNYDYLEFRVRGDGHTYITSIRMDQYGGGDQEAWQAPLRTKPGGGWQNVRVNFKDFIFSFRGRLVTNQEAFASMPLDNIMALGITMAASEEMPVAGDFRLELQSITAAADPVSGNAAARKAFQGFIEFSPDVDSSAYGRHGRDTTGTHVASMAPKDLRATHCTEEGSSSSCSSSAVGSEDVQRNQEVLGREVSANCKKISSNSS